MPKNQIADYDEWVDKFRSKLPTDDCYTPEDVYEAILAWCRKVVNWF